MEVPCARIQYRCITGARRWLTAYWIGERWCYACGVPVERELLQVDAQTLYLSAEGIQVYPRQ